jgi:hypothetical protein
MRLRPNDRRPRGLHYCCMDSLRTFNKTEAASWLLTALPSLMLSLAVSLDQFNRGPSVTYLVVRSVLY